jgi:hypothetical protein
LEHIGDPKLPLVYHRPSARVAQTVRPCVRGPSGTLARTVRLLVDYHIDLVVIFWLLSYYWDSLYSVFSGFGGLKKKLAGRLMSKCRRADDLEYNPATDSEAQSSTGGGVSLDTVGDLFSNAMN